jgi:hypothetical protein
MNTTTSTGSSVLASTVKNAENTSKKVENYSAETTANLALAYAENKDTDALAVQFGKSSRSIIAKLSRMGIYVKSEYTTKTGETPISKEEIVTDIATLINANVETLESLEKANKTALQTIYDALLLQATLLETN